MKKYNFKARCPSPIVRCLSEGIMADFYHRTDHGNFCSIRNV
jgi:hypothetical protein